LQIYGDSLSLIHVDQFGTAKQTAQMDKNLSTTSSENTFTLNMLFPQLTRSYFVFNLDAYTLLIWLCHPLSASCIQPSALIEIIDLYHIITLPNSSSWWVVSWQCKQISLL